MKAQIITIIAAGLLGVSARAKAQHVEQWTGSGVTYTPAGKPLGSYNVEVVNTEVTQHVTESVTTITAPGYNKVIRQKITEKGNGWTVVSNLGHGRGACYGSGTCENYIQGPNGFAYSTTMMSVGRKALREVTFMLKNGKAVLVMRNSLSRVK